MACRGGARALVAALLVVAGMLPSVSTGAAATLSASIEDNGGNGCSVGMGGQGTSFCFLPEVSRVLGGDTVTWTDNSGAPGHTITRCTAAACPAVGAGSGSALDNFNSGNLTLGATFGHTFNGPGTYNYYCSIHGYNAMHGSVIQGSLAPGDLDGDGKTDLTVFRPSSGAWFTSYSSGIASTSTIWGQTGGGDVQVPADYDGTGLAEVAVFRPATGVWYVLHAGGGYTATVWGQQGDVPVPADYDNAGRSQIAVFRPSTGTWYVLHSGGSYSGTVWGQPGGGDIPVPADYDGASRAQIAVFRPATGTWYVLHGNGTYTPTAWGQPGSSDVPVPADYDNTRRAQIAVYRQSTGEWFVLHGAGGYGDTVWGRQGDIPQPGDYNGDGSADLAVYRPATGDWFVLPSGGGTYTRTTWGIRGDFPTVLPYAIRQAALGQPVIATTSPLPGGTVGSRYDTTLQATGGLTPYSWSVSAGTPPPGLSLDAGSGVVSGTPTQSGTFTFTVGVMDSSTPASTASRALTVTIGCPAHSNGLGQSYFDCSALGTPGDQATYTATMAQEAAGAWPPGGTTSSITCGAGQAVVSMAASSAAVWVYSGTLAGRVHLNSGSSAAQCPIASDPSWN